MKTLPPLSLYIHIPWCVRKCPYCDFNSWAVRDRADEMAYVDALLTDLEQELPLVEGRALESIFIGGGTPSLFSEVAIDRLLEGIERRIAYVEDIEITLEANPGAAEAKRFAGYRKAGVNRLSIGIQSFNDESLKRLGRIHNGDEGRVAVQAAREAGFERINLDLMFGLPGQGLNAALNDLQMALALEPGHISYYQLTLEPDTPFYRSPPPLPDSDQSWEMQRQGQALLETGGYHQYEVSAYAREGRQCRHNLNYWAFGDYLGIGAGAHGKVTRTDGRVCRRWKLDRPDAYMQAVGAQGALAGQRQLDEGDFKLEFMMNALRLNEGVSLALFERRTGLAASVLQPEIRQAMENGWLEKADAAVIPSEQGRNFLNDLIALFLTQQG